MEKLRTCFFTGHRKIADSILDEISLGSGNDFLKIFNSEIEKIKTGKGHDDINVSDSNVKNIDAGKGNDKIHLENSTASGTIKGGDGDDYIQINKSDIFSIKRARRSKGRHFQENPIRYTGFCMPCNLLFPLGRHSPML